MAELKTHRRFDHPFRRQAPHAGLAPPVAPVERTSHAAFRRLYHHSGDIQGDAWCRDQRNPIDRTTTGAPTAAATLGPPPSRPTTTRAPRNTPAKASKSVRPTRSTSAAARVRPNSSASAPVATTGKPCARRPSTTAANEASGQERFDPPFPTWTAAYPFGKPS